MSRLRHPVALTFGVALLLVAVAVVVSGPCEGDLARSSPTASFEEAYDEGTLTVTLTEGRIPAAGTVALLAVVAPADGDDPDRRREYRLVGSDGPALDPGQRLRVRNVTVDGRLLRDGDVVRVVWRGRDTGGVLGGECEEHAVRSVTLDRSTVGDE